MDLLFKHKLVVRLQWLISWVCAFVFVGGAVLGMRFGLRYRVKELSKFRKELKLALKQTIKERKPILVCANHLTLIDSLIINMALFSLTDYLIHWRLMPWNMPERKNFSKSLFLRAMCYLGKCLPIERGGSLEQREIVLGKFTYLLECGELVCVFPEGTRSRTGLIKGSAPTYSVGQFVQANPDTKVLCLYLRGEGQKGWSQIPKLGEQFSISFKVIEPKTSEAGRRGHKIIAEEIMSALVELEDSYFAETQPTAEAT